MLDPDEPSPSGAPWGGDPLPPAEEPYPEGHPNRQMMEAPPASPLAPGPLGGLFRDDPRLPLRRREAFALTARTVGLGAALAGAAVAGTDDPTHLTALSLVAPGIAMALIALAWVGDGGGASLPPADRRRARAVWGVTLTLLLAWQGAALIPGALTGGAAPLRWTAALVAGIALLQHLRHLASLGGPDREACDDAGWASPSRLPHGLALGIAGGAALLIPLALALPLGPPEVKLLSRLMTLGLVVHAALAQRRVGGSEPGAEALRVGSLCGAYRWVLWAGLLIPLTLVAVSLVMPALAAPALLFAAALLLPGIFGWAWVDVRAAQGEGRRQAR